MDVPERICSIEGCERMVRARGWCFMHWKRWRRHGDPEHAPLMLSDRFWASVEVRGPDECWPWGGHVGRGGYGQFGRAHLLPHRFAYTLLVGPIPEGLTIDHTCHNADLSCAGGPTCPHRRCCNPAHLEPVTGRINALRGRSPAAVNARKIHCIHGHPLVERGNRRVCRECERLRMRAHRAKS